MSELIECNGCGRSFTTEDATGMLAAIKGPCPTCGGSFRLAPTAAGPGATYAAQDAPRPSY